MADKPKESPHLSLSDALLTAAGPNKLKGPSRNLKRNLRATHNTIMNEAAAREKSGGTLDEIEIEIDSAPVRVPIKKKKGVIRRAQES